MMTRRLAALLASLTVTAAGCSGSPDSAPPTSSIPLMPPGPTKPAGTAEERIKKAQELADQGELVPAIETLEEALLIDDKNREALRLLGVYGLARGREVASENTPEYYKRMVSTAEYVRRLHQLYPEQTEDEKKLALEVYYDEATAHAKSLRIEETLGSVRDLVGAGFRDFDRIRKDPAWSRILEMPQFRKSFDEIAGEPARS